MERDIYDILLCDILLCFYQQALKKKELKIDDLYVDLSSVNLTQSSAIDLRMGTQELLEIFMKNLSEDTFLKVSILLKLKPKIHWIGWNFQHY